MINGDQMARNVQTAIAVSKKLVTKIGMAAHDVAGHFDSACETIEVGSGDARQHRVEHLVELLPRSANVLGSILASGAACAVFTFSLCPRFPFTS